MVGKKLSLDKFTEALASVSEFKKISSENNEAARKKMIKSMNSIIKGELTQRQRTCILMYYGEGMKMREISAKLGIGVSSVSRHVKKAKYRVYKTMAYYYRQD